MGGVVRNRREVAVQPFRHERDSPRLSTCDPRYVADVPRPEFGSPPPGKNGGPTRPFPRIAYVYGWLVVALVLAEGINSFTSGRIATGVILVGLIPLMVWLMHTRRHRTRGSGAKTRYGPD